MHRAIETSQARPKHGTRYEGGIQNIGTVSFLELFNVRLERRENNNLRQHDGQCVSVDILLIPMGALLKLLLVCCVSSSPQSATWAKFVLVTFSILPRRS